MRVTTETEQEPAMSEHPGPGQRRGQSQPGPGQEPGQESTRSQSKPGQGQPGPGQEPGQSQPGPGQGPGQGQGAGPGAPMAQPGMPISPGPQPEGVFAPSGGVPPELLAQIQGKMDIDLPFL